MHRWIMDRRLNRYHIYAWTERETEHSEDNSKYPLLLKDYILILYKNNLLPMFFVMHTY